MNQKEINELRRRFRPEKSAISRVYGCYVNSSKEIVSDLDESLGMMPQEESEKYLSLLKKGLSGSLGKNLIDIVFSTQQVVDSEEHRLLTTLRDSQLKDNEARQTFYRKVIDSLDMGDSSYLLLLTCDSYDVPHRGNRSGSLLIIHETVRKLMDAICIWLFCGEIQSIKNGLDAGIVKAFSIFALTIDLRDHFVQLVKAVPHILDVSLVLRRGAGGNGAAVEAQLHGGHIVL